MSTWKKLGDSRCSAEAVTCTVESTACRGLSGVSLFEATLESSTRRRHRCCSGWKTNVEDPIIGDNTTMTGAERRLFQYSWRLRVRGMDTAVQEVWAGILRRDPVECSKLSCRRRNRPSLVRQWRNRGNVCEEQSGNEGSDRQSARPTTRDRAGQETAKFLRARQGVCDVWRHEHHRPGVGGQQEGHESAKPKEYFSLGKLGHSKSEYRTSQL